MKILKILTIFLLVFLTLPLSALAAEPPDFESNALLLEDLDTGQVLYAKNEGEKAYPASLTKIMTALVVLDMGTDMNEKVTVTEDMFAGLSEFGSTADIKAGEILTVRELLECLLISSANEAANILAEHTFGSVDAFVVAMNEKAEELGCKGTHFANPHGLHDEDHYTTASDMAIIAREALTYEVFADITSTGLLKQSPTNLREKGRVLVNTNSLITKYSTDKYYYSPAYGVKTGFTTPAGHCLVTVAKKNGLRLLSVVMGAGQNEETGLIGSFTETVSLLDWGFGNFERKTLINAAEPIRELPVRLAKDNDYVVLAPESSITMIVPKDLDPSKLERVIDAPESTEAPVKKGARFGTVTLKDGDTEYGTLDLVTLSGAERSAFLYYLNAVTDTLKKPAVMKGIGIFFAVIVCYILFMIAVNKLRKKTRRRRRRRKAAKQRIREQAKERARERETARTR